MVVTNRALEAQRLRKVVIERLETCECLWPLVVYRNGSGHDSVCPVHIAYLNRHKNG